MNHMNNKALIIISTSDIGKAQTGTMYAVNALKHAWLEEVKLVFFGPAESLLLKDPILQELLREYQSEEGTAVACKFIADRDDHSEEIEALGVEVKYVGKLISNLIKEGYIPMVW